MITKAIFKHQEASHLDQNLNFECFGYRFPTPCLEDIFVGWNATIHTQNKDKDWNGLSQECFRMLN